MSVSDESTWEENAVNSAFRFAESEKNCLNDLKERRLVALGAVSESSTRIAVEQDDREQITGAWQKILDGLGDALRHATVHEHIREWICDDLEIAAQMTITPKQVDALADRICGTKTTNDKESQ